MTGRSFLRRGSALPAVLAALLLFPSPARVQGPDEDYARADPEPLGVKPVPAREDPKTGFVVGGKNATVLIARLTEIAGQPVGELEQSMRPGRLSSAGFLGKKERLLAVLAADNRYVVDELGLAHQQLARPLLVLGAVAARDAVREPKEVTYQGRRFRIRAKRFNATVTSPFEDGTETNCEATVENVDTGKKLTYSLLVPQMIERYGFYEGQGTRFRLDPRRVVEVFDFLAPAKRP
jgi:hypothetical protein